jgi:small subunit ribosomal protein S20
LQTIRCTARLEHRPESAPASSSIPIFPLKIQPGKKKRDPRSMANHVSSLKRSRQTITKTAINRANKSKLRGALRLMREALVAGDKTKIVAIYRSTTSVLDKAVQKGVLHKNTASRYKGRLNARVKAVVTAA